MTRLAVFAVLGLVGASSQASAHCYAVWRYPWPQHCSPLLRPATARKLSARVEPTAPDASYYVEITKLPEAWERELGLEELKRMLSH